MSRITGYGRGWQEEKAGTRVARFLQIMREPASTKAYVSISIAYGVVLAAIFAFFAA